jgi:hypothetical protein
MTSVARAVLWLSSAQPAWCALQLILVLLLGIAFRSDGRCPSYEHLSDVLHPITRVALFGIYCCRWSAPRTCYFAL